VSEAGGEAHRAHEDTIEDKKLNEDSKKNIIPEYIKVNIY
jgi:hypothetical protein